MLSKNHKQNTNFQIVYFLIGSCSTADGAYSLLLDLREERQSAINNYKVSQLKNKAKKIEAKKLLEGDEVDKLNGKADLLELENNKKQGEILYNTALDEINFINKCIEKLQPLRKFVNLPDAEANELVQAEEWRGELIRRAENYMITTGNIPPDQFDTMRMHPDFNSIILPRIKEIKNLMLTEKNSDILQKQLGINKFSEILKLDNSI